MADKENGNKKGLTVLAEELRRAKPGYQGKGQGRSRGPEEARENAALQVDFSRQTRRHGAGARPRRPYQCLLSPPSRQDQPRRDALQLHLGNGRDYLLPVYCAHLHGRPVDVLLSPHQGPGLPGHYLPDERRAVRTAAAQHAPLGRAPDGDRGVAAYVQGFPDRLLQEAAGNSTGASGWSCWC